MRERADLARGEWRIVEIGHYLGVTKQRVHQLAREGGFPSPSAEDHRGRLWDADAVRSWGEGWARGRPWRRLRMPDERLSDVGATR